ncbi:MAG: hypothetical protein E7272_04335 [Pseudobutyrivibrio ruminis]|uniref:Uncharacterized protein n=1 Tax=Pseudobutyrivibrio ruminis TaxID=46206 RepID=A0A927YQ24_9FIRM|nr:hypothetical protein [Pseudobutyrivibrio ruminis]
MKELLSGRLTTYKGIEYYYWKDNDDNIDIYTWDKNKVDKTFTQISDEDETMYEKRVQLSEIGDIYEFNKLFTYKGSDININTTKQGQYFIFTYDSEIATKLGLKGEPIDRPGVMWYHAIIDKDDKDLEYVGEDRRKISL